MTTEKESERVSLDDVEIELPPAIEQFLGQLRADRKALLKGSAYKDPAQLRAFVGQYLYPRLFELVELLGNGLFDTYSLSVSNANHLQRLHRHTAEQLRQLGADIDEDDALPGVSSEVLDEFQQAFYAIGTKLQEKLPDDPDMQKVWNRGASLLSDVIAELMGESRPDEDDGDDDRDDGDDDRDDGGDGGDDGGDEEKTAATDEVDTKVEGPKKKAEPEEQPAPQEGS